MSDPIDTEAWRKCADLIELHDVVIRKDGWCFRSGCSAYEQAVVISLDPFTIASIEGDMLWRSTIKPEDVEPLCRAPQKWIDAAMRRLPEVQP